MMKWLPVIGLLLTAAGILVGFSLPTVAARWAGPESLRAEMFVQIRFALGAVLVIAGTAVQIYASWPR
jgi:hypothetical protein